MEEHQRPQNQRESSITATLESSILHVNSPIGAGLDIRVRRVDNSALREPKR